MVHFVLFITVVLFAWFCYFIYSFVPMGGDRVVGQAWTMFFIGSLLSFSILLLFILMDRRSCFLWISNHLGIRATVVSLFCLSFIMTVFFSGVFSTEWYGDSGYPVFLKHVARSGVLLWLPVIIMVPFYFLIRSPQDPSPILRYCILAGMAICGVFSIGLLYGWINDNLRTAQATAKEQQAVYDEYHLKNLREIRDYPADAGIGGLLSHSFVERPEDIHRAAIQKIMERPDWENEIMGILKDRDAYIESYYYLSGNHVTKPQLFREPLIQSIGYLAEDTGLFLRETNNVQDWILDHFNIGLMLNAISHHFQGQTEQFVPYVKQLRDSIRTSTPEEYKKIQFNAVKSIDNWLDKNE